MRLDADNNVKGKEDQANTMRPEGYEENCKKCPSLSECISLGVGCSKVGTYTIGHNTNETEVIKDV